MIEGKENHGMLMKIDADERTSWPRKIHEFGSDQQGWELRAYWISKQHCIRSSRRLSSQKRTQ